jgi:hypothetical protein
MNKSKISEGLDENGIADPKSKDTLSSDPTNDFGGTGFVSKAGIVVGHSQYHLR